MVFLIIITLKSLHWIRLCLVKRLGVGTLILFSPQLHWKVVELEMGPQEKKRQTWWVGGGGFQDENVETCCGRAARQWLLVGFAFCVYKTSDLGLVKKKNLRVILEGSNLKTKFTN